MRDLRRGIRAFSGGISLLALGVVFAGAAVAQGAEQATVTTEYTNDKLVPKHWVLKLNADGSGQFASEEGNPPPAAGQVLVGDLHKTVQLSPVFTAHVFAVARGRKLFAFQCESHLKVAFQGTKRLSYTGPEGTGSCEYNYSKDKEIQALGDSLQAVAATIEFGARIEKLLQHDRLGLDKETEDLASAAHSGSAMEMGAIRETLEHVAGDEQVLERARKRARQLLVQAP